MEEAVTFFGNLRAGTKPGNLPDDLRMVAGPWLSAEEAKVMFIFEIATDWYDRFQDLIESVSDLGGIVVDDSDDD